MEDLKYTKNEKIFSNILLLLFIEPKKCVSMFLVDSFTDSGPPLNGFYQIYFDHAMFRYWLLLRKLDTVKNIKAASH